MTPQTELDADGYGPRDLVCALCDAPHWSLSPGVLARLSAYRALLLDWSGRMNLVGPQEMGRFWRRHALDSLQLLSLAPAALRWADLGAGAGLPGLAIACALADRPGARVVLIDSVAKKGAFQRAVIAALGLPAEAITARVEAVPPEIVDVVTARAFAPLPQLIGYARPWLALGAQGLFLKGQDIEAELTAASKYWKVCCSVFESRSSSGGRILRVDGVPDAVAAGGRGGN
jgi:16S rRNA (guanine527-N7)-methyltransferase